MRAPSDGSIRGLRQPHEQNRKFILHHGDLTDSTSLIRIKELQFPHIITRVIYLKTQVFKIRKTEDQFKKGDKLPNNIAESQIH